MVSKAGVSPTLCLDSVDEALMRHGDGNDELARFDAAQGVPLDEVQRNNFLFLCDGNADVYDAIRNLISEKQYWAIEEEHFALIVELIRDYNLRLGRYGSEAEVVCPTVGTIEDMYREYAQSVPRPKISQDCSSSSSSEDYVKVDRPSSLHCGCCLQHLNGSVPASRIQDEEPQNTPQLEQASITNARGASSDSDAEHAGNGNDDVNRTSGTAQDSERQVSRYSGNLLGLISRFRDLAPLFMRYPKNAMAKRRSWLSNQH